MRKGLSLLFLLCLFAIFAQAQSAGFAWKGFYVAEKKIPFTYFPLASTGSEKEHYIFSVEPGSGRVQYRMSLDRGEFQDFNPQLKGFLYRSGSGGFQITNEKIAFDRDAVYFSTIGDERALVPIPQGSYRLSRGVIEEIASTSQEVEVRLHNGGIQRLTFSWVGTASPIPGGGYVFPVLTTQGERLIMVKEKSGAFRTLFSLQDVQLMMYGVWTYDGVNFQFSQHKSGTEHFSVYNTQTGRVTDLFSTRDSIDGEGIALTRVSKSEDGTRYTTFSLTSGKVVVMKFAQDNKLERLHTVLPTQVSGFIGNTAEFYAASDELSFIPLQSGNNVNDHRGVLATSATTEFAFDTRNTIFPNGKKVTSIENRLLSVSGCRLTVPLQQDGFVDTVLYEAAVPCLHQPLSGIENSTITIEGGSGFTLGSPQKVEVRIGGGIGLSPATVLSDNKLTFAGPPLSRCSNRCSVSVVLFYADGKTVEGNTQTLTVSPIPVAKPRIVALTDLYGQVGAAPGKAMSLWGDEFCSLRLPLSVSLQEPTVPLWTDSAAGCRVLVDGRPVGLYFAFTASTGASQINLLLPYALLPGEHTLEVEKFENRNGALVVTSKSDVFRFTSVTSAPTFFKLENYSLTIQNGSKGYSLVSAENPARAGDYLVIYLSGGGQMQEVIPERDTKVSPYRSPVEVNVGGKVVTPLYAGTQGVFPGIEQVNFQVPDGLVAGLQSLKVVLEGKTYNFSFHVQ